MSDLLFYNVGTEGPRGARRMVIPVRRALRRVLRPIFQRQVEIFQSLCDRLDAAERHNHILREELHHLSRRHEALVEQNRVLMAFGWDYAAMVRRLGVLEDRIETLATVQATEGRASVPFREQTAHGESPLAEVG